MSFFLLMSCRGPSQFTGPTWASSSRACDGLPRVIFTSGHAIMTTRTSANCPDNQTFSLAQSPSFNRFHPRLLRHRNQILLVGRHQGACRLTTPDRDVHGFPPLTRLPNPMAGRDGAGVWVSTNPNHGCSRFPGLYQSAIHSSIHNGTVLADASFFSTLLDDNDDRGVCRACTAFYLCVRNGQPRYHGAILHRTLAQGSRPRQVTHSACPALPVSYQRIFPLCPAIHRQHKQSGTSDRSCLCPCIVSILISPSASEVTMWGPITRETSYLVGRGSQWR
ncbi:hypothetical protein BJV77DRAFT_995421 [Russula vinacea]|nr:hypothetical protein BJV77DRAFT_995421 [Russula vinacea]